MKTDKLYCASQFLQFRCIHDQTSSFNGQPSLVENMDYSRDVVYNADDLQKYLQIHIDNAVANGKTALALSGGIDSAILARLMPKGSTAYTFRCVVDGIDVIDETKNAAIYAKETGLNHKVIDIHWDDIVPILPILMKHKNAPIHSIEAQIYLASLKVKKDGFDNFIFGESADLIYGGMDGLLKKEWLFGEFVDRYSYILPYKVLKNPSLVLWPFQEFEKNGFIDSHDFINKFFRQEGFGSYVNATTCANINFIAPFAKTKFGKPLDFEKIRSGYSKPIVRDLFHKLYPTLTSPVKTPMPRPTTEWFIDWQGPKREEFLPNCHINMSGDQKWLIYILEAYLNMIEKGEV